MLRTAKGQKQTPFWLGEHGRWFSAGGALETPLLPPQSETFEAVTEVAGWGWGMGGRSFGSHHIVPLSPRTGRTCGQNYSQPTGHTHEREASLCHQEPLQPRLTRHCGITQLKLPGTPEEPALPECFWVPAPVLTPHPPIPPHPHGSTADAHLTGKGDSEVVGTLAPGRTMAPEFELRPCDSEDLTPHHHAIKSRKGRA